MNPQERAEYFMKVDQLQAESLEDSNQESTHSGIPQNLAEIFEISNANRRINKKRKKQKVQESCNLSY
jgi:hypothetical protein